MAPFPIFDTEYVQMVEDELNKELNEMNNEYESLPVEACAKCGSLHIESDELELTNVCMRCGSVNDLVKYDTINDYMESKHGKFWNS